MFKKIPHKRGSIPLYLLLLATAIMAMVSLKECSYKRLPDKPDRRAGGDTINVAIEVSPMGVTISGDTLGGIYYTMLKNAAAQRSVPLRFHPFTQLATALRGLDQGRYQIVVSDIPATIEVKEKYLLVTPAAIDQQLLIQRRDSSGEIGVKTQFNLGKKEVTLPKDSPFIPRLRNLSHEIGDTIYIVEDPDYSSEQLIIMTAMGEVPATVATAGVAEPLLERYPQLDGSVGISFSQFQGWAVAKSDSLLRDSIAAWFAK